MKPRVIAAAWSLAVSLAYLVLFLISEDAARSLLVAFIALLLVPAVVTEAVERNDRD